MWQPFERWTHTNTLIPAKMILVLPRLVGEFSGKELVGFFLCLSWVFKQMASVRRALTPNGEDGLRMLLKNH